MNTPSVKQRTLVVGDCHGCGLELQELIEAASPTQIILVGDLFDRAKHGHLVWKVLSDWKGRIWACEGNHERKMLKFLLKQRDSVPPHYVWAIDNLAKFGVNNDVLRGFLESLPTLLWFSCSQERLETGVILPFFEDKRDRAKEIYAKYGPSPKPGDVIIAHAGVNIHHILDPDSSFTVYGDVKNVPWWDKYQGNNLVLYGHLSEKDCLPRIRINGVGTEGIVEKKYGWSIGLDTACAHNGYLTGYIIETGEFFSVKAKKDWASELKAEMRLNPPKSPLI